MTAHEQSRGAAWRQSAVLGLGLALTLFTLSEVNYARLGPQTQLSIFALFGLLICFLTRPLRERWVDRAWSRGLDLVLAAASVAVCLYIVVQSEPFFERWWMNGQALGDRAGAEVPLDYVVGLAGVVLILEGTRRVVGWALPILSLVFLAYAYWGQLMPDWLFPHRGYPIERITSQVFLHSQGVFGVALGVMFTYVFLFVVFGALLELTGATEFIVDYARAVFRHSVGGPAKVSVLSSGLMGSLSGSAVANTATTGTFTIPLMRSAGFAPHVAGGVEAAASSGGALVPPVMGAGAYMMLEIITPPVTYVEIIKAALLPAVLYYLSLFLIVHFYSLRLGSTAAAVSAGDEADRSPAWRYEGLVFFVSLAALIAFVVSGLTVFRAVTLAMAVVIVLALLHARTRSRLKGLARALDAAGRSGVALILAAACVGMIVGVVTLTGVGTKLPATILPLAQDNLFAALAVIMLSSIVLGMGLPSAVCYLLLATLMGSVLSNLGVVPLAAHLFIFYFCMMSMVTPPVALAAYTGASIAGSRIMPTAFAAFRFALVGFTLPYLFVYRPELLLLAPVGETLRVSRVIVAVIIAVLGVVPLAAGIAGFLFTRLVTWERVVLLLAAASLLFPGRVHVAFGWSVSDLAGLALLIVAAGSQWRRRRRERAVATAGV